MEQQAILVYDGTMEGFLCCLFTAYEEKLKVVDINPPGAQAGQQLFTASREVITEPDKAKRVWTSLKKKASPAGLRDLKWTFLSEIPGMEMHMYSMIRYILAENVPVDRDFSHPAVLKVSQAAKKVGREKHRMEAFVRFRLTKDEVYFAAIEPDFNVLPLIKSHFKNRYADQKWIIYDLKRNFGIAYDLSAVQFITLDLDPAIGLSGAPEAYFHSSEIAFQKLWDQYFTSTNIKSRANQKLHVQHLPKRYWKYLTEKNL
ncbi:TIGR03915 family putative DNA repair protein [Salinimicrobium sediminilitoris]|uniref:TIGR03915 family putative DNA repair protein n=1 Tax=Salinimicrobium sediminilitoris TaxID=2876715 RepID=UPI001E35316C|nr:TIGR03915 family putative DNA repair protein [Salinimicrobium sediminilitoris]MCC8359861.1 TIGR03915 family putative DNA repair protein [Salinimicrobium sediminilitoris]